MSCRLTDQITGAKIDCIAGAYKSANQRQYHERRSTFIGISKTKIGLHSNRRETVTLIQDDENLREMALDWLQYANDDR